MPDIHGEYDTDVERAQIALEPQWFPAVENRGEGVFVQLRAEAVKRWLGRPAVTLRLDDLASAPIGIRTSSPQWRATLRAFVRSHRAGGGADAR